MSSVVNVKVAHIRPAGYANLKEWMADPANEYVGRVGVVFVDGRRFPPTASPFANPFKVGKDGSTREEVIRKFQTHIRAALDASPALKEQLLALKGKRLGCWCAPEPCHADVLLALIKEYEQ